jgi:diguanylate cyclase (GGDEF)-like protein
MIKPSDFSPSEAPEVENSESVKGSLRTRWLLRAVGAVVLVLGWLAVSLNDLGETMFFLDTAAFLAAGLYAFTAAAVSRREAVKEEKRLRLRLLVHNMELESMAIRDELTQLFNRRYLFERLERELQTAKGFQRPLALIAIEVTSVHHVNHTYGYAVGDQLLAAFGRLLLEFTRATDVPARMSANKFAIILPDTSKRGAHTTVERLAEALAALPLLEEMGLSSAAAVSFSICGYPWGGDTVDAIMRDADTSMRASEQTRDSSPSASADDSASADTAAVPPIFRRPSGPADDAPDAGSPQP